MLLNDSLAKILMRQVILVEEIVVEKMAEGAVSNIMEESGDSHVLFNKRGGWALVTQNLFERWVKMLGEFASHVHGTKGVLKTAMFGRGVDPTGALKLVNVTQPLYPRR